MLIRASQIVRAGRARGWRGYAIATAVPAVALLLAACGGSGTGDVAHLGTSTAGGGAATPAASGSANSSSSERNAQLVKLSQCMRANGVPGFPDPTNGRLILRTGPGGVDPSSPAFQAAAQACKSLQPAGIGPGPGASSQLQSKALKFAACIRKHGVPNMPDPTFKNGNFTLQVPGPPTPPNFQRAVQACQSLSPLPGGAP
jgi:hypothetical protein